MASPCLAQTKPGEIKGVDAMGDKSRSAQDGWSQAPVPREQSAAKDAPNPGGQSTGGECRASGSEGGSRRILRNRAAGPPGAPDREPVGHQPGDPLEVKITV